VRELHRLLGIKKAFTHWFKDQQKRIGLIEGKDFTPLKAKSTGGRPIIDFITSFDNGKSMYHASLC